MHRLSPGVKIFVVDAAASVDRVQLSLGTSPAPPAIRGVAYEEHARIPAEEWRSPTPDERSLLVAESAPEDYGAAISITTIPQELLRPFKVLQDVGTASLDRQRLLPLANAPPCVTAVGTIKAYLQRYLDIAPGRENGELKGGIVVNAPALATVTVDSRIGKLIGLHLDDWYRLPYDRRHESPNRICINIGCEDRFLLLLNLPIDQLCKAVLGAGIQMSCDNIGGTSAGRLFMTLFPSYPAIRVRIRPGEAYIAPTENIIHDGSSVEMSSLDISLSLRGRFRLTAA
jgi:hypothetical protein